MENAAKYIVMKEDIAVAAYDTLEEAEYEAALRLYRLPAQEKIEPHIRIRVVYVEKTEEFYDKAALQEGGAFHWLFLRSFKEVEGAFDSNDQCVVMCEQDVYNTEGLRVDRMRCVIPQPDGQPLILCEEIFSTDNPLESSVRYEALYFQIEAQAREFKIDPERLFFLVHE